MTDLIRVRDQDTGYRRTIPEEWLSHGNYEVLKDAAVDPVTGDVVPPVTDLAPVAYGDRTKADLEAEIDRRNATRDPEGEDYISPAAPGNKPDLVAALEADDKETASTATDMKES